MEKYDKSEIGIVRKIKCLILSEFVLSSIAGLAGAVGGGSDDYKIWIEIPKLENPLIIKTSWKVKIGDSVKVFYNSKQPKKCKLDDTYLWNKALGENIKSKTNKTKKD